MSGNNRVGDRHRRTQGHTHTSQAQLSIRERNAEKSEKLIPNKNSLKYKQECFDIGVDSDNTCIIGVEKSVLSIESLQSLVLLTSIIGNSCQW